VNNVSSSHNRRQGLSIGPSQHVYIVNSTFQNTKGTLPEAGVDFEPMKQGPVDTVRMENNVFANNHGNGVEMHDHVSHVTFVGNLFTGNGGFGLMSINAHHMQISGNHGTRNGLAALRMSARTHNVSIRNNKLQFNSTRYMSASRAGGGTSRDIQVSKNAYAITQSNNTLSPRR
jgi:hypothetical protein